jgi:hypothetical protein
LRSYQIATAVGFMILAAVAMVDSRAGALVDTSGTEPGGIGAGFYPFWSAALMFGCAVVVAATARTSKREGPPAFENRAAALAVLKIVAPMVIAAASIIWLGFYVVSALYMALFARWIGHYRWVWVLALAIGMPVGIYIAFEVGFRVGLPKSFLYDQGLLPF